MLIISEKLETVANYSASQEELITEKEADERKLVFRCLPLSIIATTTQSFEHLFLTCFNNLRPFFSLCR